MADVDVEVGGFQRTLKDLGAGAAGGIAQVLLGWYYLIFFVSKSLASSTCSLLRDTKLQKFVKYA